MRGPVVTPIFIFLEILNLPLTTQDEASDCRVTNVVVPLIALQVLAI